MKILLDHNIPHELRPLFPEDHDVYTTQYRGRVMRTINS